MTMRRDAGMTDGAAGMTAGGRRRGRNHAALPLLLVGFLEFCWILELLSFNACKIVKNGAYWVTVTYFLVV